MPKVVRASREPARRPVRLRGTSTQGGTPSMRTPVLPFAFLLVVGSVASALAGDDGQVFDARLSGYNEAHFIAAPPALRGAISTAARAKFRARLGADATTTSYELSHKGLDAARPQSHIT